MVEWLLEIGGGLALLGVGGLSGFIYGKRWKREAIAEEVEHNIQQRRNALTDRGRTTERRPEHDGIQPSRTGRVRIVSKRPRTADRPSDQL